MLAGKKMLLSSKHYGRIGRYVSRCVCVFFFTVFDFYGNLTLMLRLDCVVGQVKQIPAMLD